MIRLVVALPAEARPLIERYGLERQSLAGPPVWRRAEVSLVISGVGREAAARATARLAEVEPAGEAAWLNVGVGGHRTLPLGALVMAHRVAAATGDRAWYPPLVFEPPCPTAAVVTVDRPETRYPEPVVYEMEAAGFYEAAARLVSAELIQVLKVISDNRGAPVRQLTARDVERLVGSRIDEIAEVAAHTAALAAELAARREPPVALAGFVGRWRFSATQRHRLERLLRRLAVLEPAPPDATELAAEPSAAAVLTTLEKRLSAQPPGLG